MISAIFHALFYNPLYNALILLSAFVPGNNLGLAIILLTLIVRFSFAPLSHKALHTQRKLKEIEPDLNKIKEKHKNSPEEQGRAIMALYKEHGVNPFSSLALLFVQLPLFIALYWVAQDNLASIATVAYSFVTPPAAINPLFFGVDVTQPSVVLAFLAGLTYFIQAKLSIPPLPKREEGAVLSFKDEFMQGMSIQTRYVVPLLVMFAGFQLGSAVLLYWTTSNLFSIGHELLVKRKAEKIMNPELSI